MKGGDYILKSLGSKAIMILGFGFTLLGGILGHVNEKAEMKEAVAEEVDRRFAEKEKETKEAEE